MAVSRIEEVIKDIQAGKMVILVDDEDRENEGDLCMAAQAVTPEAINFMAKFGRGLICLTLDRAQVKKLGLPMMVEKNKSPFETGFTVSIESRTGVTTGISAAVALAKQVLNGTAVDREAYLNFLKMGGSRFPLDELIEAGVDLHSPEPIQSAIEHFGELVDQLNVAVEAL